MNCSLHLPNQFKCSSEVIFQVIELNLKRSFLEASVRLLNICFPFLCRISVLVKYETHIQNVKSSISNFRARSFTWRRHTFRFSCILWCTGETSQGCEIGISLTSRLDDQLYFRPSQPVIPGWSGSVYDFVYMVAFAVK